MVKICNSKIIAKPIYRGNVSLLKKNLFKTELMRVSLNPPRSDNILECPEVISWITGDKTFLNLAKISRRKNGKYAQEMEKNWGNQLLQKYFNNNSDNITGQWTTTLGEQLLKEILEKNGHVVKKPTNKNGYLPDWETEDAIWECKSRNYTTIGTAGEKILGTPFKYADIPKLYGKPLKIVVIGFQEKEAIENFHLFDSSNDSHRGKIIQLWNDLGIQFVKLSSLLIGKS